MTKISEAEFARIVDGILEDRDAIIRHNPIGTDDEVLLWMLMSCLISYLNLSDLETPCFTGVPNADTYRDAIQYILQDRRLDDFEVTGHLARLTSE